MGSRCRLEIPSPAFSAGPGLSGLSGWMDGFLYGIPSLKPGAGPGDTAVLWLLHSQKELQQLKLRHPFGSVYLYKVTWM